MISFKDFVTPVEKYVALQYDAATQMKMRDWCLRHGFDLSRNYNGNEQHPAKFDFHTTIFFTTTKHTMSNGLFPIQRGTVRPIKFELLGVEKNIPVLKVDSPDIRAIRSYFEDTFEMKDQWDEYKPHVSLSYTKNNLPNMMELDVPDFPLTYDTLKISDAIRKN